MSNFPAPGSGDGSRPMTDGAVDNVGAAKAFDTGQSAIGEPNVGPGHPERMQHKRADAAAEDEDDAVPLDLHGDKTPETNTEPPPLHKNG
jgi:hypothetical protein